MSKTLISMLKELPSGWEKELSQSDLDIIHELLIDRGEDADYEQHQRAIRQAWEGGKAGKSLDESLEVS